MFPRFRFSATAADKEKEDFPSSRQIKIAFSLFQSSQMSKGSSLRTREAAQFSSRLHYTRDIWKRSFTAPVRPASVYTDLSRKPELFVKTYPTEEIWKRLLSVQFSINGKDYEEKLYLLQANPKWLVIVEFSNISLTQCSMGWTLLRRLRKRPDVSLQILVRLFQFG